MQKKLIALAVASVVSAPVFAAGSSVSVYGVIDVAVESSKLTNNVSTSRMVSGGNTTNRLGFKGSEDLGNGLMANFVLEHQPNPDNGTDANAAAFWHRTAKVGISSKSWGQVNFGRQYSPWFSTRAGNDIFYTAGVGSNYSLHAGLTRISNSIRYDSNSINGFKMAASYSFGNQAACAVADTGQEDTTGACKKLGSGAGVSIAYGNGPLKLAYAYDTQARAVGTGNDDRKLNHLAGSYDFKVVKLVAGWNSMKMGPATDWRTWYVGGVMPVMGKDLIKLEYTRRNNRATGVSNGDSNLIAIGYEHPMSKRTNLYATYAKMNNDSAATAAMLGTGVTPGAGFDPSAFQMGIRHKF
jgi:predicted porin